jgi:pimeloyl-ACP methyl ester carboxylesterase
MVTKLTRIFASIFIPVFLSTGLLLGCSTLNTKPSLAAMPPIVFMHGNGDHAALWQTTLWRFESNGWPADRLFAVDMPLPQARDDNSKPQAGRSSADENRDYLKAEVERVLKLTGASKVVLMANSRGGNAVRNYIQTGGGDKTVSHAILGGTPNHGVWAIKGFREANEFSGTGPFLTMLNSPKNAAGDEVISSKDGVQWMTVRSLDNDKFAQPDGLWIGAKGTPTNVTFAGPELKGAKNVVIPKIDHREVSFSKPAFDAAFEFITGAAPKADVIKTERVTLSGRVTGITAGVVDNMPVVGAQLEVYATGANGERLGAALASQKIGENGAWKAIEVANHQPLEFVIMANGYATTHIYRSAFHRSSSVVHLRAERIADADSKDANAKAIVNFFRPRGYFDLSRDTMSFDGKPAPGLPPSGAGLANSKIKLASDDSRAVSAEFNGERITGRTWPASGGNNGGHTVTLELTY